jgi:hypothetical protein
LILRELRTIAGSAARATLLLAKGKNGLPAETPYAPPPPSAYAPPPAYAPPLEEFEEPAAKTAAEAPAPSEPYDPRQDSPLAWMVRANRTETSPDPRMPQAEASDAWLREPLAGRAEEWVGQPSAEPERSWESIAAAPEPAPEPEREQALLPPHEPALSPESFPEPALEDLDEPAAEIVPEPELEIAPAPEPEPRPAPEPEPEPEPHPVPEPATEIPHEPFAETVHEGATEPAAPEPAPDTPPKPEIVGHYDAQGAHYTLYADGSIEAETPHGVYRFASMAELKRFIEGQAEGA